VSGTPRISIELGTLKMHVMTGVPDTTPLTTERLVCLQKITFVAVFIKAHFKVDVYHLFSTVFMLIFLTSKMLIMIFFSVRYRRDMLRFSQYRSSGVGAKVTFQSSGFNRLREKG